MVYIVKPEYIELFYGPVGDAYIETCQTHGFAENELKSIAEYCEIPFDEFMQQFEQAE